MQVKGYFLHYLWRRWTGIEPAGRGSPVPPALKAGEPTRRSDTSARQGNRPARLASAPPDLPPRRPTCLPADCLHLAAIAGSPITLRAVKKLKRLIILGALVALAVVLARKIREI